MSWKEPNCHRLQAPQPRLKSKWQQGPLWSAHGFAPAAMVQGYWKRSVPTLLRKVHRYAAEKIIRMKHQEEVRTSKVQKIYHCVCFCTADFFRWCIYVWFRCKQKHGTDSHAVLFFQLNGIYGFAANLEEENSSSIDTNHWEWRWTCKADHEHKQLHAGWDLYPPP